MKINYNNLSISREIGADYMEAENLAAVYQEIAILLDVDIAIKIHELFKGQQIIFPKQLYSKEYIYGYIHKNYNGKNIRELSQMFDYSDRRVRQILNEI
jgi:Mor family transcriptional regulator